MEVDEENDVIVASPDMESLIYDQQPVKNIENCVVSLDRLQLKNINRQLG